MKCISFNTIIHRLITVNLFLAGHFYIFAEKLITDAKNIISVRSFLL